MVVGEGFVNHQEHNAGEEGEGQADKNGDLEEDRTESHTVGRSQLVYFPTIQAALSTGSQQAGSCVGKGRSQGPREFPASWLYH